MPRSSGRARFASLGKWERSILSDADWQRAEDAYGRALDPSVRSELQDALTKYEVARLMEVKAAPAPPAKAALEKIAAHAASIIKLLDRASHTPQTVHFVEHVLANTIMRKRYESATPEEPERPLYGGELADLMSYLSACAEAATSPLINDPDHLLLAGEAFRRLVADSTQILANHELPVTAAKDSDKRPESTSDFVRLLDALQRSLTKEVRFQSNSLHALAGAIVKARRSRVAPQLGTSLP